MSPSTSCCRQVEEVQEEEVEEEREERARRTVEEEEDDEAVQNSKPAAEQASAEVIQPAAPFYAFPCSRPSNPRAHRVLSCPQRAKRASLRPPPNLQRDAISPAPGFPNPIQLHRLSTPQTRSF